MGGEARRLGWDRPPARTRPVRRLPCRAARGGVRGRTRNRPAPSTCFLDAAERLDSRVPIVFLNPAGARRVCPLHRRPHEGPPSHDSRRLSTACGRWNSWRRATGSPSSATAPKRSRRWCAIASSTACRSSPPGRAGCRAWSATPMIPPPVSSTRTAPTPPDVWAPPSAPGATGTRTAPRDDGLESILRPPAPDGGVLTSSGRRPSPPWPSPTTTSAAYLPETLASLAAQTCSDLEVLVIDDGSTCEQSRQVWEEQQRLYPQFRFIRQANAGLGAARNRALREAKTPYFIPVDADNVATPGMVGAPSCAPCGATRARRP